MPTEWLLPIGVVVLIVAGLAVKSWLTGLAKGNNNSSSKQ